MVITVQFGPGNRITREFPNGTTVGTIVGNNNIKAALGVTGPVRALINRRHADTGEQLQGDTTIHLETVANSKAATDIEVTVRFGPANSVTRRVSRGTTVGDVVSDPNIKAALGYGDSVRTLIDRQEQPADVELADGDVLVVETAANAKAA